MGIGRHALAALATVVFLAAVLLGARALVARWQAARALERGIALGRPASQWGAGADVQGINTWLEQYPSEEALSQSLDLLVAGGFTTVRQRFPWDQIEPQPGVYDWSRWDVIVRQCEQHGLRIIAVLDASPAWARPAGDAKNPLAPPRDPADLAAFARALATRYGRVINDYQVWDEPNVYPHWGERDVDPAGYVQLLRTVGDAIRAADPGARIIAAALAPTLEPGGRYENDLVYLRGMYEAGARGAFDAMALKAYGFWSGPDDRRVDPGVLNFSRLVAVHEEMAREGDGNTPVWAVAWGWNALPPGWQGRPSPWGTDDPARQYTRDLDAISRAQQEWPWLGLMCYAAWQPMLPADDPLWGLALVDAQGHLSPLYGILQERFAADRGVLYPGQHPLPAGPSEIRFWGTRLDLQGAGSWQVSALDGRPLSLASGGAARGVSGLPAGEHRLTLSHAGAGLVAIVSRDGTPWLPWKQALPLAGAFILAAAGLFWLLRPYPWLRWGRTVVARYQGLRAWPALGVGAAGVLLLAAVPGLAASAAALLVLALIVAMRPRVGLELAVFLAPLAPLQKHFGGASFSFLEIVTLLTVASQLAREALGLRRMLSGRPFLQALGRELRRALGQVNALDWGWVALVVIAVGSLAVSEKRWVSLRELRVVVLQAAFLYGLIVRLRPGRTDLLRMADLLALGAVAITLQGLYQYAFTQQVIVAEGVRRIRGIYGSPNNLALVLGRLLPLMLAVALAGSGKRRWLYGLATVLGGICLFLTFSKGALLVGMPAALLTLGLLAGGWARTAALALVGAGLVGLVPFLRTARFHSLLSGQGTTLLRINLWESALDMVRDHPLFGVGLDNFLYQYPRYIRPEALSEPNLSHPHDWILDFWLRLGLAGLFCFVWLQVQFLRRVAAVWRRLRQYRVLWALAIGLAAGMVDMLAHGLIDAAFFVVELAAICAIMMGMMRQLYRLS